MYENDCFKLLVGCGNEKDWSEVADSGLACWNKEVVEGSKGIVGTKVGVVVEENSSRLDTFKLATTLVITEAVPLVSSIKFSYTSNKNYEKLP